MSSSIEAVISQAHTEPQTSRQRPEAEVPGERGHPEAASNGKSLQGLRLTGMAPGAAPEGPPTAIDASMSMTEVALVNLRRYLSARHVCEPGARLGKDPEQLHE